MNVLLLTQFYPPEPCAASNRNAAVAQQLRDSGHRVHVVTGFPNFPSGRIPQPYRGRLLAREDDDGISVTRLWTYASPKLAAKSRLLNWGSLALTACAYLLGSFERIDVLYVSSPPITLALPALAGKYRHGAKLVVDVRDAYPEVAINLGMWKATSRMARLVGRIAGALYRNATGVVCATEGIREAVVKRSRCGDKTIVARNGFDRVRASAAPPFERKAGTFVAAYAGNMGLVSGLDVILDAAHRLTPDRRIRFVLAGGGNEYERLVKRVASEGLTNVEFLGVVPHADAMAAMRDADICLVPTKRGIVDCLPSKMFDALSVGCPVLLSGEGEAQEFIERSSGGWCVAPEDPVALAEALQGIVADPPERARRGASGRAYVERYHDRTEIVRSIVSLIEAGTGSSVVRRRPVSDP